MGLRINFLLSKMKHNIDSSSVSWSLNWYKEKTILFQENKRQAIDLRQ